MNPVLSALLKEFAQSQNLEKQSETQQFEHFVNFIVLADTYNGEFDILSISTGEHEFGLDGIAFVVNGSFIENEEEVEEHKNSNKYLKCDFYFIQSKISTSFDSGELLKIFNAVSDFFKENSLELLQGSEIVGKWEIKNSIYKHAGSFTHGLPTLHIVYATLGQWKSDKNLMTLAKDRVEALRTTNLFDNVNFIPLDLKSIQSLYFKTKNASNAQIDFPLSVTLPAIPKVSEAYIGVISAQEYLKLLTDDHNKLKIAIFGDNVRDLQEKSTVNREIDKTLRSDRFLEFPLRNNGTTVVCRRLQRVGTRFTLDDYQVVNGCQTSNVIFDNKNGMSKDLMIPIKIICSDDDEVTNAIIIGSNRQNEVAVTQFWALEPIQKQIELYFDKVHSGDFKLFYERRRGQFAKAVGVEKVRIISPETLLKDFAAMVMDEPHQVSKYYTGLLPMVGKTIFNPNHSLSVYHASAYVLFKLDQLFRNKYIPNTSRKYRYMLAMCLKFYVLQGGMSMSGSKADSESKKLTEFASNLDILTAFCKKTLMQIDKISKRIGIDDDRQAVKSASLRNELRTFFDPASKKQLL